MNEIVHGIERDAIVILAATSEGDADLLNCCHFLLGVPTWAGITEAYAVATVKAELERRAIDAGRHGDSSVKDPEPATGPIGEGESTGEP